MKQHVKAYLNASGYATGEFIPCENCGAESVDIHHIHRRGMGGSKTADNVNNLMALCRDCHDMAHRQPSMMEYLQRKHDRVMDKWKQQQ